MVQNQTEDKQTSLRVHESTVALLNEIRGRLITRHKKDFSHEETILYMISHVVTCEKK